MARQRKRLPKAAIMTFAGLAVLATVAFALSREVINERVASEGVTFVLPLSAEISQTTLPDGRILEVHGAERRAYVIGGSTTAEISLPEVRRFASVTVMPGGQVLLWGGIDEHGHLLDGGRWFDPQKLRFAPTGTLGLPVRAGHTLTLLTDGRLLMTGGWSPSGDVSRAVVLWDPNSHESRMWEGAKEPPRISAQASLQGDGSVQVDQGLDARGVPLLASTRIDVAPQSNHAPARTADDLRTRSSVPHVTIFPATNSTNAPIEGPLTLRFSDLMNLRELNADTVTLLGPEGVVPIQVIGTNGGRLAFVQLKDDLYPGSHYTLFLKGLHSTQGVALPYTATSFTTGRFNAEISEAKAQNTASSPDSASINSSKVSPLFIMAGGSHGDCVKSKGAQLCHARGFVQDGAFYPGENNAPDVTGAHWRLYAPHQSLPDTRKLESQLPKGDTVLIGQIRQIDETPVQGVDVSVGEIKARTNTQGIFVLQGVSAGRQELFVDGGPASHGTLKYGRFIVGENVKAKSINYVPYVMYLPRILPRDEVALPTPSTHEVVITHPDMPGLELHVPAGAIFKDRNGHVLTHIAIVPTPVDHAPFPLPDNFPMYFTIQPGDAMVQGLTPDAAKGIRVVYPNYGRNAPNSAGNFWLYSAEEGWRMYGGGHVTSDAKQIAPGPGVSFVWAMGAGVTLGNSNPPNNLKLCDRRVAQPVDLQTGTFLHSWNDFSINDVIPLIMTRAYNSADGNSHMFGIGGNSNFGMHLYSTVNSLQDNQTFVTPQLVLPCGEAVAFDLVAGTDTWPLNNTVWEHTGTNSAFYGATLQFFTGTPIGEYWLLTMKDGTELGFQNEVPNQLTWIQDRFGNQELLTYNGGLLEQVTSPSGRTITLNYDSSNRVTSAVDNTGRTISYGYNTAGTLATVTYPDQTTEQYTYDNSNHMLTMQDRRSHVWVTNQYDVNGRVTKQTYADNTYYQFAYTTNSNSVVTAAAVTDPDGNQEQVTFDPVSNYPSSVTEAYGTSLAQTTTFNREPSGFVDSETDALGRTTAFAYDALGNVTSITRLSGTPSAVATQFTYTSDYNQLASLTDPLGHTIGLSYTNGCLTQITDALNHSTTMQCNAAGQMTSIQDALGHTTLFAYHGYDLQSTTDPLDRTISYVVDSLGRRIATRDPLGNVALTQYDTSDRITSITDALNQTATETYDGNGNQLSVSLPNQGAITSTYDNRNRRITRSDAMGQNESWTYDGMDNMLSYTDRKKQITDYSYDALNRRTLVSYADGSGIQATYDAGNRLTDLVDSSSGNFSWTYDGLDRATSAITPQGTIGYSYDAASRLVSMTPAAQSTVNYSYDVADRLSTISQGSESVQFTYDAADRRSTLTLPNGIVVGYGFDVAGQLTGLNYTQGNGTSLGNLTYGYDADGRITSKGGSLATDFLPAATTQSATFDLNDRETSFNGQALSYDANGNLLSDGTNTYTWNARNQLIQINQGGNPVLTYGYDALGRRVTKTVGGGTPIQYLYDGSNIVQEMQGSLVNPILNGLGVDDRFARNDVIGRTYYLTDILGSTMALTDSTGAIREQYSYDPYGNAEQSDTTTGFTNPYQYTGRESDAPGLYFYRARYYSSLMGSFISQDKLWFGGRQLSFYAYVGGSPLGSTDPSGLAGGPVGGPRASSSFSWRQHAGAGGSYGRGVGSNGAGNSNDPQDLQQTPGAWPNSNDYEYTQICIEGVCRHDHLECHNKSDPDAFVFTLNRNATNTNYISNAQFAKLYPDCICTQAAFLDQAVESSQGSSPPTIHLNDLLELLGKLRE